MVGGIDKVVDVNIIVIGIAGGFGPCMLADLNTRGVILLFGYFDSSALVVSCYLLRRF
ncbi:MAG: hypothetical protein ACYSWP_19010 [Planctomycetota bacterium]|jgi:hypothetical protein